MTNFPAHPFGTEITTANIIDSMKNCRGWEDKYRLIIQLGKRLPSLEDHLKSKSVSISGCESNVWLIWKNNNNSYQFAADSDARIVKGLLALILAASEGKTHEELMAFNFEKYFEEMYLLDHLSPSRNNGIRAIIDQIKHI
ncbi:cysteine desulfurase sulfur acceptor subunit CsdE [Enterovibrio makurazakiensis]|uniref:Cysteine desulfurase sulfur acceptor subunit CsdE n=1 Tax=Enterovibrio gelatinilyticus TaxID=2899819 RepID=A0ABT5R4L4_9GAMM|nr:cysteine desulfurase sulfur acceptor subunit CsdE [Enterovibrio sp. ZSDZ42]MDD1795218.1 cysteine desulfurase sulfur acceptor subunit CsdE [Enterovibrio sp. ZSDZ42]